MIATTPSLHTVDGERFAKYGLNPQGNPYRARPYWQKVVTLEGPPRFSVTYRHVAEGDDSLSIADFDRRTERLSVVLAKLLRCREEPEDEVKP